MKKIVVFLTTLALLLAMAMPVFATETWYGRYGEVGDTEALQTVSTLANSLYDAYGVDAVYLLNNDAVGTDSAQQYFESVAEELLDQISDDYIVYTCTANDAYIVWDGSVDEVYGTTGVQSLFEACEEYENAGQFDMAAITFLSNVLTDLNAHTMGGSYEAPDQTVAALTAEATTAAAADGATENSNALTTPEPSSEYFRHIVDYAGLLDAADAENLEEKLREISERQQFDVVIVTTDDLQGKSAEAYADDYYDYNGYGYGANHDGCLLLFDMSNRSMHLSTTGFGEKALTDAGIDYINDEIYTYARKDNWKGAFNSYADNVDKFVTQAKEGTPYDVGNLPRAKKTAGQIIKGIAISLLIGLVVGFIIMKKIKGDYEKAVRSKASASDYLVNGSLQLTGAYENFMYNNVTQRRIETESSSGGSSTHTGSSGTSHGGGGRSF